MAVSKYDYIGVFDRFGVRKEFKATSLRDLARQMGVAYKTVLRRTRNTPMRNNSRIQVIQVERPKFSIIDVKDSV